MASSSHFTDPRKWFSHSSPHCLTCNLGASLFLDPPAINTQILGKLNRVVPDGLTGWLVPTSLNGKIDIQPLAVNLSSCLPAIGRPGKLVNCCPPRTMLDDPISDFEFPDPATTPIRVRRFAHRLDDTTTWPTLPNRLKSTSSTAPGRFSSRAQISRFRSTRTGSSSLGTGHRIFLYFHERILGSLIGNETFALPFWGWDSPDRMTLPEFYLNGSFNDHRRDRLMCPPWWT
ncbi:unnamed protein product [Linum tenue]|uniref:Tyrosinase copper-binding domain-containing protein n=1 Tax=Linum tenue TaxID=586396 RepID=A0AAV0IRM0_9ROSI|nr:unnamed protein product [Linum tenue]